MGLVVNIIVAATKCVNVLAWLFPLVYPRRALIRAVESGPNSETQKLVTYWILLYLILLLEHAFLLKWLPVWPYLKLWAFFYLAIRNFDHAFYIYNLHVHPCLSFDPKIILEYVRNLMKSSTKSKDFLDAAEIYIEENGPEALERLIAHKRKCSALPVDDQRQIKVEATGSKQAASADSSKRNNAQMETGVEIIEGKGPAAPEQLKWCEWPDVAQNEIKADVINTKEPVASKGSQPDFAEMEIRSEVEDSRNAATADQARILEPEGSETGSNTIAVESMEPEGTSAGSTAAKDKVLNDLWTCAVCQVTGFGEKNLTSHLQGRKHKSMETVSKEPVSSPNTSSWASTNKASSRGDPKSSSSEDGSERKRAMEQETRVQDQGSKKTAGKSPSPIWCDICQKMLPTEVDMACHLKGRKHLAQVRLQAASALQRQT